jgi:hypothetical protein
VCIVSEPKILATTMLYRNNKQKTLDFLGLGSCVWSLF